MAAGVGAGSGTPAPNSWTRRATMPCSSCWGRGPGDPQVEALADAVHAAVGEKGVGLRQDGQLVYLGKDLDIGRNISQLFRPAPTAQRENGPYPLPAPQASRQAR